MFKNDKLVMHGYNKHYEYFVIVAGCVLRRRMGVSE